MTAITINIDYSMVAEAVDATIALATAGRPELRENVFEGCRLRQLATMRASEAARELCGELAGYIASAEEGNGNITIDMTVASGSKTAQHPLQLAQMMEQAVTAATCAKVFTSAPQFQPEAQQSRDDYQKKLSMVRQMLCM